MIWVATTLIASVAQTGRNAAQAGLTARVGTIPATAVRFVFGLPFAILALSVAAIWIAVPQPDGVTAGYAAMGAAAQIGATAFMLLTMRARNFGVATALMKTEPVTLALIGTLILAEPLGPARLGAIGVATVGVVMASGARWSQGGWRPVANGIIAGALFGLSAIGFRGAIVSLPQAGFFIRALTVLVLTLAMQSAAMMIWLALRDRAGLRGMMREWRVSLAAGALGAFASLFWFIGFALTPAANVRTLSLIEVPMAQILSGRMMRQRTSPVQMAGLVLIVAGVGWLLIVTI